MIQTERLTLRRCRVEDCAELLAIHNSDFVMNYNVMERLDEDKMLETLEKDSENPDIFCLEQRATGKVVGAIYLERDSLRHGVNSMSVSYYLGEQFAGLGYMSEAMPHVFCYAFEDKALALLSARIFVGNLGSHKLMLRCGMTQEATLRCCVRGSNGNIYDDGLYSITREEWLEKNK